MIPHLDQRPRSDAGQRVRSGRSLAPYTRQARHSPAQFTAPRLRQALEASGQRGGPANRGQPVSSETNQTSSAVGSGR